MPRTGSPIGRALGSLVVATLSACAGSPMLRAAHDGDRVALLGAIEPLHVKGKLTLGEVADVAHAVVEREILTARTPDEAVARIHEVRACSFAVDDVLAERMKTDDVAGGEAAFERLEAGAIGPGAARDHAASADDRWRAVAVSGMTGAGDHDARMRGLVDGSPLVRRAALRAMVARDDGTDFTAIVEAGRLDPDPLVRGAAIRALYRLHEPPPNLVQVLRDLWTVADDGLRGDVATALASPTVLAMGGREELAHLLGTSHGNEAVMIAGVILDANVDDPSLRAAATAELVAALTGGGARARIHALAVVPFGRGWQGRPAAETATFLGGVRDAARSDDIDVRLAALGRIANARDTVPATDWTFAHEALEALAAPDDASALRASRARLLLAEAGDLHVQAWVEADLRSADPAARLGAAEALAALGRASRAAPLLADDDASVRTRAACTILLAARLR
jgi:hypothetical protein